MDMLVLRAVALERQYGWALSQRIHEASGRTFFIQQGSLYPCLRRLEIRNWIKGEWVTVKGKNRLKYYEATKEGRKLIPEETDSWEKLAADIAAIQKRASVGLHPSSGGEAQETGFSKKTGRARARKTSSR